MKGLVLIGLFIAVLSLVRNLFETCKEMRKDSCSWIRFLGYIFTIVIAVAVIVFCLMMIAHFPQASIA